MIAKVRMSDVAYLRDDRTFHTGEALLLAMLMHTHGENRSGKVMLDVQRIMKDQNLD